MHAGVCGEVARSVANVETSEGRSSVKAPVKITARGEVYASAQSGAGSSSAHVSAQSEAGPSSAQASGEEHASAQGGGKKKKKSGDKRKKKKDE